MTKTSDILAGWTCDAQATKERHREIDTKIDALQAEIEVLRQCRNDLPEMDRREFLSRLGIEIAGRMPGYVFGLSGPFGIDNLMLLTFTPAEQDHVASLTVRTSAEDESHAFLDYDRNMGLYGRGTVGELNGMNYADHAIPDDIDEIVAMIRQQIDANRSKAAA